MLWLHPQANRRRPNAAMTDPQAPDALDIRPAGRRDAAAVIDLIHRVFDEYGFIWDPEDEFWDLLGDEFPYAAPRGAIWTARDASGAVVGSIAAERLDQDAVELHRLYLDAHLRGRGHGRALLETGVDWARAGGAERVILWSDTRFEDAHRLYERRGFRRSGQRALADVNQTVEYRYELGLESERAD